MSMPLPTPCNLARANTFFAAVKVAGLTYTALALVDYGGAPVWEVSYSSTQFPPRTTPCMEVKANIQRSFAEKGRIKTLKSKLRYGCSPDLWVMETVPLPGL